MRRPLLFFPLLISLMLLGPAMVAGCGGTGASDATTASAALGSSGEITTAGAAAAASVGDAAPASGATPGTPDAGTTLTTPDGLPAVPLTPEEIKNTMGSAGMGTPDQLQIYDYRNFGHYAAAYVMAADENVYLVLFNDETGGWVILDAITGLDWPSVQAELRAKAAPEDLITWANPGGE